MALIKIFAVTVDQTTTSARGNIPPLTIVNPPKTYLVFETKTIK